MKSCNRTVHEQYLNTKIKFITAQSLSIAISAPEASHDSQQNSVILPH